MDAAAAAADKLGSSAGGAAGATRDLRGEFDDLTASLDPAKAAMQDMQKATALADDALAAGVISAAEHAEAIDQIGKKYAVAGAGSGGWSDAMSQGIESIGAALEDMIATGEMDFDDFAASMETAFSGAVAKMVAEASSAQLGKAFGGVGVLGGMAGPLGGLLGGLAGGLLGGLFGRNRRRRERREQEAEEFAQERGGLQVRILELQGKTAKLRQLELKELEPANRALQRRIWSLEKEAQVRDERSGLRGQLLALQGREKELRRLELKELDPANRALQIRIWALQDEQEILAERTGLEDQLLQAAGDTVAIRQRELQSLDPSNRALQERIWALQDEQAITTERLGLEGQLLQIAGDTNALRQRELQALDPSNRALQERIWALENEQAILAERNGLQAQWLQLIGDTNSLRQIELDKLDASNRALQLQIWAEEDRQRAVEDTTRAIEKAVAAVKPEDFANLFEYGRALALANNGLLFGNTNGPPGSLPAYLVPGQVGSGTTPSVGAGGNNQAVVELQAIRTIMASVLAKATSTDTKLRKWDADGLPATRAS
jgi:hypothetical protein